MNRLTAKTSTFGAALLAGSALLVFAAAPSLAADAEDAAEAHEGAAATFDRFGEAEEKFEFLNDACVECHNFTDWAGGVAFDTMSADLVEDDAEIWEHAVEKLRGGLMPPPGETRPDKQQIADFVGWMEAYLDHVADQHEHAGYVPLHRLNRTEYANAVRDLLALDIDPAALLPKDDIAEGFTNIADVLQVSPTFVDQYIAAARTLSVRAVGDPAPRPASATLRAGGEDQTFHIEGLPLGTRGGALFTHDFPAGGEYLLNVNDMATGGYVLGMEFENTLIVTVDGRQVYETLIGGEEDLRAIDQQQAPAVEAINARLKNIPMEVTGGPHEIGVTFVAKSFAESDNWLRNFNAAGGVERLPRVSSVEIRGPFNGTPVTDTPSREKIFVCYPESADQEQVCAEEIVANLARRAFRGEVTEDDLQAPMDFYAQGAERGGFEEGIRNAVFSILASPNFLYRMAPPPDDAQPGELYALDDRELASRLSFFLWSTVPDDELLDLADEGRLSDEKVLNAQVERMLADPKAEALTTSFAFQWLNVDDLDGIDPDGAIYPDFAPGLKSAFEEEMRLWVDAMIREDHNVMDFLTADWTYVNQSLALHYGIDDVRGDQFRRVTLEDPNRYGVLGKGAILLVTSYANRTSPVLRGAYVLENIIGAPPAAPPPNVEAFPETEDGADALTVRERLVAHRAAPSCNSCHGVMDPLGLALENFTAAGAWRDIDRFAGMPIDASGVLPDGTALSGPADLRDALTEDPSQFVQTLTKKLMMYALGRAVEYKDMPTVREIAHGAKEKDYHFSDIVKGIVNSDQFRMQETPDPEPVEEASLH